MLLTGLLRWMPVDGREMPGLPCRRHQPPHVEVAAPFLERRRGEEHREQALGVGLELPSLGRRVAVAEQQQVHLRRRVAVLLERDERAGRRLRAPRCSRTCSSGSTVVVHTSRHVLPLPVRLRMVTVTGARRHREAHRLVKRPRHLRGLVGRGPLVEDRAEAARIEQRLRRRVAHVEAVGAVVRAGRRSLPARPDQTAGSITASSNEKSSCFASPVWK